MRGVVVILVRVLSFGVSIVVVLVLIVESVIVEIVVVVFFGDGSDVSGVDFKGKNVVLFKFRGRRGWKRIIFVVEMLVNFSNFFLISIFMFFMLLVLVF